MKRKFVDIAVWTAMWIVIWAVMVVSYYIIKYNGVWASLTGYIVLGIVFGAFPRLRRWLDMEV